MKFENTEVWGFKHALRGMRNPKNSWAQSDSRDCYSEYEEYASCCFCDEPQYHNIDCSEVGKCNNYYAIGPKDMKLAQTLIKAGPEHRKFLRQIFVSVDITAPLYWWKEFDTYKIGTVANSTSTMHKITSAPITLDCFEIDDFNDVSYSGDVDFVQTHLIPYLEYLRRKYLETKDKIYWKELIRWLPESWLQTRTVTLNYENIYAIVHQRKFHKLNEWSGKDDPTLINFINWARSLPYAQQFIFIDEAISSNEICGKAMKEVLNELLDSHNLQKEFKDYGINITNPDGSIRTMYDILSDIADKFDKNEIF